MVKNANLMAEVERNGNGFVVSAVVLQEAFGLSEAEVKQGMHDGTLMSRCEVGQNEDEGRWRLVFRHGHLVFRLTVDADGFVLSRARFAAPLDGAFDN